MSQGGRPGTDPTLLASGGAHPDLSLVDCVEVLTAALGWGGTQFSVLHYPSPTPLPRAAPRPCDDPAG